MDAHPDSALEPLENEWQAALADAALSPRDCALIACEGEAVEGRPRAASYPRGRRLSEDSDDPFISAAMVEIANQPERINLHRIAIFKDFGSTPFEVAILAGKLRHELEHARQRDRCGDEVIDLSFLAEDVLRQKVGGLRGSTNWINLIPSEADANAAAAMFLRRCHSEQVEAILASDDAALARSLTPPEDLATLPKRQVCFLYLFREICRSLAGETPMEARLETEYPGAGNLWSLLDAASVAAPR